MLPVHRGAFNLVCHSRDEPIERTLAAARREKRLSLRRAWVKLSNPETLRRHEVVECD